MPDKARTVPHVIVGVDRSMAGLAAIRAAVAEAVRRGVPLHSVRVGASPFIADDDLAELDRAFQEALGGFPPGVQICRETTTPPIARALTRRACHSGDLLFLGNGSHGLRRWWRRVRSRSVVTQCLLKARCTVVVVRSPEMCDDPRRLRRVPEPGEWVDRVRQG